MLFPRLCKILMKHCQNMQKGNAFHDFLVFWKPGPPDTLKSEWDYVYFALSRFPVSHGPKPCSRLGVLGTFCDSLRTRSPGIQFGHFEAKKRSRFMKIPKTGNRQVAEWASDIYLFLRKTEGFEFSTEIAKSQNTKKSLCFCNSGG